MRGMVIAADDLLFDDCDPVTGGVSDTKTVVIAFESNRFICKMYRVAGQSVMGLRRQRRFLRMRILVQVQVFRDGLR